MASMRACSLCLGLIFFLSPLASFAANSSGFYAVAGMALDAHVAHDSGTDFLDGSAGLTSSNIGQGKLGASFGLGYQFALREPFVVMLEAGKDLGTDMSLSTTSMLLGSSGFFSTLSRQWELKRDWYIAIKPGMYINPSTLVYLSLAHHPGSAHLSSVLQMDCLAVDSCLDNRQRTGSTGMQGTGIGAGMQSALTDKLFFRVEVERIDYGRININFSDPVTSPDGFALQSLKLNEYLGRISLGYRF